jgi:hypothetical protein
MNWLNWQPRRIFPDSPGTEATKPSKPGSVGFVGPDLEESQKIALALVKASGVRMTTHNGNRIIAVPTANDTPKLREALAVLGYGNCTVLHLDTAPLRGKSSAAISEAIEAAETGGEL